MDDRVLRGMAKWPDVPAVYGWLTLDRRGNWLIRGEHVSNSAVSSYIGRNYERDGEGRWFFQNGPQRVYVELEYTPVVYRVVNAENAPLAIATHTGEEATALSGAWIDEHGALLVETEHGVGVVNDRDLGKMLSAFIDANEKPLPEAALGELMAAVQEGREAPLWLKFRESNVQVERLRSADVPRRFAFQQRPTESPAAKAGA